jgi:hypothetical protein
MAHFAKLGSNSKIISVLTLDNKDMLNADGVEDETVGQQYLEKHNNWPAQMWIQTSYNTFVGTHKLGGTPFRGNYAGIGYTWDKDNNIFYPKKPYASWVLDVPTASWKSPLGDAPDDLTEEEKAAGTYYIWNEDGQSWNKEILPA